MGKKMGSIFLPNHFSAENLLAFGTRHGQCTRRDFWAWPCSGPLIFQPTEHASLATHFKADG